MPSIKSWTRRFRLVAPLWLFVFLSSLQLGFAQSKVIATFTLPDTPIKIFQNKFFPNSVPSDRNVLLGSLGSDLWRGANDPSEEYWAVTDRGPNGQIKVDGTNRRTFWVPEFNPAIMRIKTTGDKIEILETIPIVGQSGKPVTGLPNLAGLDETPYNYSAKEILPYNPSGLDTEGLVRTSSGDFWVSEEYSPSLVHVDRTGKIIKRYVPEGLKLEGTDYPVAKVLPGIYATRKINRGFEGIALSPDQKTLYLALQSPLLNPNKEIGDLSRNTRVLVFDIASEKPTAEYVYQFDESRKFDPGPKNTPDEMKLSGVVALNSTTLLILERTDWVAKLYSVDISEATNILATRWNDRKTVPTLEALSDPAATLRVLPKSLVLNLSSLEGMPEKIEGIAVINANTIAVTNDNDFDSEDGNYDADGNNVGKGKKSQLLIISLSKPLPLASELVTSR